MIKYMRYQTHRPAIRNALRENASHPYVELPSKSGILSFIDRSSLREQDCCRECRLIHSLYFMPFVTSLR